GAGAVVGDRGAALRGRTRGVRAAHLPRVRRRRARRRRARDLRRGRPRRAAPVRWSAAARARPGHLPRDGAGALGRRGRRGNAGGDGARRRGVAPHPRAPRLPGRLRDRGAARPAAVKIPDDVPAFAETPDRYTRLTPGFLERCDTGRYVVLRGPHWASVSGVRVGAGDVEATVTEVRGLGGGRTMTWWL